jgi:hypothetical protein
MLLTQPSNMGESNSAKSRGHTGLWVLLVLILCYGESNERANAAFGRLVARFRCRSHWPVKWVWRSSSRQWPHLPPQHS